jgi:RNA recognition motif-containing protein
MPKLFIVGFPRDMEEVELVELFSNYGIVNIVTIVTDQITGESKGYGFITMADGAGAERAITALDQAEIDGRVISVRFTDDKIAATSSQDQYSAGKKEQASQDLPPSSPRTKRPRLPKP